MNVLLCSILLGQKRQVGHVFAVCSRTESEHQVTVSPCGPHETSVLVQLTLEHQRSPPSDVSPPVKVST